MSGLLRAYRPWIAGLSGLLVALIVTLIPYVSSSDALAIPAWSRKYDAQCVLCHAPLFARLNEYGERFMMKGYQAPDDPAGDGDGEGKKGHGGLLFLDDEVGHWFTARLNLTPVQYETNANIIEGDTTGRLTLGNTNWLQLFVAGSIAKNVSIYIENEITVEGIHQAWYYLGFENLGTRWLNLHVGRVSPTMFAPYPDRLPQLPAIGGPAVTRISSARGAGGRLALDIRSARYGLQYWGWGGPLVLYGGVTSGSISATTTSNNLGYWAGARLYVPAGTMTDFAGSSIGLHFDGGTDFIAPESRTNREDMYTRIMPGINVRFRDKVDLQANYVMAKDDNWTLLPDTTGVTPVELNYQGVRAVATYYLNQRWALSAHYDNFNSDRPALLSKVNFLYVPVISYLYRENFRVSFYPGFDLRDKLASDKLKRHLFLINIRTAI